MNKVELDPGPTSPTVRLDAAMGLAILVRKDTTLREIASVMLERNVDSVIVVDADGAIRGVVTDRDLTLNQRNLRFAAVRSPRLNGRWVTPCDAVDAACAAAMTMTADDVMDSRLTTATIQEPIGAVVDRMIRREVAAKYSPAETDIGIDVQREGESVRVVSARPWTRRYATRWISRSDWICRW